MQKFIKFLSALGLSLLLLSSCSKDPETDDVLVVGASFDNPPYTLMQNNQMAGLEYDLIKEIANRMGKEIEVKNIEFQGLIPAIQAGEIELAISGITITPPRLKNLSFSEIYFSSQIAAIYNIDNLKRDGIAKFSLNSMSGKVIGAQTGTTWFDLSRKLAGEYNMQTRSGGNNLLLIEELKRGSVDVLLMEAEQAKTITSQYSGKLAYSLLESQTVDFAIAMRKHSPIKHDLDKIVRAIKRDGTLDTIKAKWIK